MSRYAVSDLHGHYNLYKQIKEFLKPDDIVYCLGDCGDRGPSGWEVIKAVYEDPQFRYIKGNHEDMLIKAMEDYIKFPEETTKNIISLIANGGSSTFASWIREGASPKWIRRLRNLSYFVKLTDATGSPIYLTHAGFTPPVKDLYEHACLWDRTHYLEDYDAEFDGLVVHGHTPIEFMIDDFSYYGVIDYGRKVRNGALWYCGCRKVNLDCGTFMTKRTVLLNLDTHEEVIFYDS